MRNRFPTQCLTIIMKFQSFLPNIYNPSLCLIYCKLFSINLDFIFGSNECKQKNQNIIRLVSGLKTTRFCFYYIQGKIICFPLVSIRFLKLFIDFSSQTMVSEIQTKTNQNERQQPKRGLRYRVFKNGISFAKNYLSL